MGNETSAFLKGWIEVEISYHKYSLLGALHALVALVTLVALDDVLVLEANSVCVFVLVPLCLLWNFEVVGRLHRGLHEVELKREGNWTS